MHKKSIFTIIFLIIILTLAGCNSQKKDKVPAVGFIGGTEGLSAKLEIVSSQLNEILDDGVEPFQISLNLQNKGEHTVNKDEVLTTLAGIDLNAFQIKEKDGTSANFDQLDKLRFEGNTKLPPSETVIVYDANYKYDEPTNKVQDLAVNYCYKYTTTAAADACLKKEVTKPSKEERCKINEQKVVGNSGAPVSVILLNERPSEMNTVTFAIQIENKGKGDIYAPDFLSKGKCIEDLESKNKIHVKVEFPDSDPVIKCAKFDDSNEGILGVIQNKASLTCTADTSNMQDTAFTKSLRITLSYVYKDDVSAKLTIKSAA